MKKLTSCSEYFSQVRCSSKKELFLEFQSFISGANCIFLESDYRQRLTLYNLTSPNDNLNGVYIKKALYDGKIAHQAIQNIIVNYHPIYMKEPTGHCIWYDSKDYWRHGG